MDARRSLGQPRLLISRTALLHNASVIQSVLRPGVKLCGVIKADAYGHGASIVADALCNFARPNHDDAPVVDSLGVATIEEADALPPLPVPLMIFQPVEAAFVGRQRERIELAVKNSWTLTLCSKSAADDVARIAASIHKRASVQVMVDTGLARSGVGVSRANELIARIASWPSLRLLGVCTHFASAEFRDSATTAEQLRHFRALTDGFAGAGGKIIRHAANSAAIFLVRDAQFDLVRPGLALYGIDPAGWPVLERPLRPVARWTAPLVGIREIPRGTGVGYGHTWTAPRDCRIGLVPIGYADGYLRGFSNKAMMIVGATPPRAAPVVGAVSMDLTTIDLTDIPSASIGDDVTVLDSDPLSLASVYELARIAGTIPYEILCRIGPRVKRVAIDPDDAMITRDAASTFTDT